VPYGVRNTIVRILRTKNKVELWSIYLKLTTSVTVHLFFSIHLYYNLMLFNYLWFFLNNSISCYSFFAFTRPVQLTNASSRSSKFRILQPFHTFTCFTRILFVSLWAQADSSFSPTLYPTRFTGSHKRK
jgi:hypothetical protein